MGNRERLLAAAKQCLMEKGYDRTTVRDLAGTAGVSMAAIGYHFGSREALLQTALFAAMEEWDTQVSLALAAPTGSSLTPYEEIWAKLVGTFVAHRNLWIANLEMVLQAQRTPELRQRLADGYRHARPGMVALALGVDEQTVSETAARTLGSVQLALVGGLAIQWLTDPDSAPSAAEIVTGLRLLTKAAAEQPTNQ